MTIAKLQATITANHGNTILSTEAHSIAHVLAESYDTLKVHGIDAEVRDQILKVFGYNRPFYWTGISAGTYTIMEALQRGKVYIDRYERAYEVWENVNRLMQSISPEGFSFKTVENEVGWFEDVEELTLQHVRTWMHGMSFGQAYNKHTEKDALYLLDTLYAWRRKRIPVPQKYIDCLQLIVDSHKEGDGL